MKNILLAISASLLLFASCSDDNEVTNPPAPVTYSGMADFFARNTVAVQHFTIDASVADTVVGNQGTTIVFPGGALRGPGGSIVTGTVDISLQEIYRNKDMLLSNVATMMVDGRPLVSAGMFNLVATQNGSLLEMGPLQYYSARLPNDSDIFIPNMGVFTGSTAGSNLAWVFDSINGNVQYNSMPPFCYIMEYNYMGWINCDAINGFGPNISIDVNTINNPNPDSSSVLVWLNDFPGLWRLRPSASMNTAFESDRIKSMTATLIAVTIHNGKIYAGFHSENPLVHNGVYNITMQEMTDAAFKAALDSLPD